MYLPDPDEEREKKIVRAAVEEITSLAACRAAAPPALQDSGAASSGS